ncbi:MAG: glycosyltransferase family 2 protein [Prevotellaceae bacterium]|jgi:hypothetical protein|nr:glycosyltransferase family 2 protein [Prevotellaceae bacterium]
MKTTTKPKLICLTPVRNEAWILDAFLTATSLWADHIIIADQNSTDGSREIYKKYQKVIMVDNVQAEYDENSRMRLMYAEARKIEGEKIFIALDADEIFTSNYAQTSDWQKIVNAKAGDIFNFQWVWIGSDQKHCKYPDGLYQWAFFDDGSEPEPGKLHVARVPWPKKSTPREFFVKDFFIMHLPLLNPKREKSKRYYYQCFIVQNCDYSRNAEKQMDNAIKLHRGYYNSIETELFTDKIPDYFTDEYQKQGIDIFALLKFNESYTWQDEKVIEYFEKYGIKFFQKLDIFEKEYLANLSKIAGKPIKDPRNFLYKLLHFYLRNTQKYKNTFFIRAIDKFLKKTIK